MVLGGLLAGAAYPALAEVMDSSPRPVPRPASGAAKPAAAAGASAGEYAALIAAAKLGGEVSFVVADAKTGEVLASRDPDLALPPASVAKAVTALYALDRLGPGYRFTTRVLATGPVEAGMVQGDLILAGGGDPTLQTDQLGDLVARLAKAGVRGATGRFLYWDGALPRLRGISGRSARSRRLQCRDLGAEPELQPGAFRMEARGRRLAGGRRCPGRTLRA